MIVYFLGLLLCIVSLQADIESRIYLSKNKLCPGIQFHIALEINVKEGLFVYSPESKDKISLKVEIKSQWIKVITTKFPAATEFVVEDDKKVPVYSGKFFILIEAKVVDEISKGKQDLEILIKYQVCDKEGVCFLPSEHLTKQRVEITLNPEEVKEINSDIFAKLGVQPERSEDIIELTKQLLEGSNLLALPLLLILGILSVLTPCVYPMIPVTVSFFIRQKTQRRGAGVLMSIIYTLGIATTYSSIGVITGLTGQVFGAYLGYPVVVFIFVFVFIALGLSMFGVFKIPLPVLLPGGLATARKGYIGAFVMGLLLGLIALPCTGPLLAFLMSFVALTKSVHLGFLYMFCYALGMGLPFMLLACFSMALPKGGKWLTIVEKILGLVLFAFAYYFCTTILNDRWATILLGVFLAAFGVYFGVIWGKTAKVAPAVASGVLLAGSLFFTAGAFMNPEALPVTVVRYILAREKDEGWFSSEYALDIARSSNRPAIIYFTAEWCAECKKMKSVFKEEKVQKELNRFVKIKIDLTDTSKPENKIITSRYNIVGLPAFAFFDSSGNLIKQYTGFLNPEKLVDIVAKIK